MNSKFLEFIRITFTIIVITLALITIYMIVLKLTGHSPTEITITYSILGILVAFQVLIAGILFQIKGDVGILKEFRRQNIEFQKQTIGKINSTQEKIKDIENKL